MNVKQIFRIIFRNRTYSLLNIFGLTLGIASAGLLLLWVEDELTFNRTFSHSNELYTVGQIQKFGDDVNCAFAVSNPIAEALKENYSGVKDITRYYRGQALFSADGNTQSFSEAGRYVDPSIFSMLDIQLLKGDVQQVFEPANPIVISKAMAKKIFGDGNPMGKILKMNDNDVFQITGVFEEPVENSSFSFQWLIPFSFILKKYPDIKDSGNNFMSCYVQLEPSANPDLINKKLHTFFAERSNSEDNTELFLFPIKKIHLYDEFKNGHFTGSGDIRKVRLFALVACIILLVACINFMNLSTARSQKRSLEVGVKKTFGAKRRVLVSQFMGESSVVTFISLILALFIIWLALPSFNMLINKQLEMQLFNPLHLIGILGVGALCTLLAGSYPAFYLSSFNPFVTLSKMKAATGKAVAIRKGLVVFQFAIAYILICATIVVYLQIHHAKNRPLGYSTEQVIRVDVTNEIKNGFDILHNELQNTGVVANSALCDQRMTNIGANGWGYNWPGKDSSTDILVTQIFASPGLMETLQMTLEGRDFYSGSNADQESVIINRSLAGMMGKEGRVGGYLERGSWKKPAEIIGITDDLVFDDIFAGTYQPVVIKKVVDGDSYGSADYLFIRMRPQIDMQEGLSKVEKVLKGFNPNFSFDYSFMDEDFERMFRSEKLTGMLASLFASLAIFISCLGLFGLSAFSVEQRKKEIGIRKVLGAGVWNLTELLVRNFMILIGISFMIGIPVAWYVTGKWLSGYEYRIDESWLIYAGMCLLVITIAILTVGFQSLRAATVNPVNSIKTE